MNEHALQHNTILKKKNEAELKCNQILDTRCSTSTAFVRLPRKKSRKNEHQESQNCITNNLAFIPDLGTEDAFSEGCKNNRGNSKRTLCDIECKASLIESFEQSNLAVTEFVKKTHYLRSAISI